MKDGFLACALALLLAGAAAAAQQPAAAPAGQAPAQPAQPAQPAPKTRAPKTPEEAKALQAIFQATTPDAQILAAENFVAGYPDSDFKATAYLAAAQSYQQKKDYDQTLGFAEQGLDAKPDDVTKAQILLLLASTIASNAREFDLDLEKKLAKVEQYANSAIALLKTADKPNPALTDAQWEAAKSDMTGDAYQALALDQMVRKDYDKAIVEFKTAIETAKDPDPATHVRLAVAYIKAAKYDDAIAACDKTLALPGLDPAIRQVAQSQRAIAVREKAKAEHPAAAPATPAAAPATPAAVPAAPAAAPKP
jgi:tetratricopeptide (TPR) repeat protein